MRNRSIIVGTIAAGAMVLSTALSSYAATVYTSSTSFLAAINPGSYTETFEGLPANGNAAGPFNFSSGGYTYTVSTVDGNPFYNVDNGGDVWLATNINASVMRFNFTSGNVTAVGGNFFSTDINGTVMPGSVDLNLSDGTFLRFATTSPMDFRGFTTAPDTVITSLDVVVSDPGNPRWAMINNFVVGQAVSAVVPEPGTFALLGLGTMAGVGFLARRRGTFKRQYL